MIFDLPTDERKPLFGAAGAKLGLRQVGLEADDAILAFRPRTAELLLGFDLNARDTVKGNLGIGLRLLGELLCLHELGCQTADTSLSLGLCLSNARVRLFFSSLNTGVGLGLHFRKGRIGLRP